MSHQSISRDHLLTRVHTELVREAARIAGKGGVASKAELATVDNGSVLKDAEYALRRTDAKVVRLEPWIDAAAQKVIGALDAVDKPGRGHGKISLAEAREAAASHRDAGARISRAWQLMAGRGLEASGAADPTLAAKVVAHIDAAGFGVLAAAKDREPSAWVHNKIEAALNAWGADEPTAMGRLDVDGKKVWVATAPDFSGRDMVEHIGVFDDEGRALGRAKSRRDRDTFALTMSRLPVDGRGRAVVVASSASTSAADPAWVTSLTAALQAKHDDGEDRGARVKGSSLPAALQPIYQFLVRNTPDGTGVERIEHEGKTAYAIHLYECVSSVSVWTPDGQKVADFGG
jgi:hypothetical protein